MTTNDSSARPAAKLRRLLSRSEPVIMPGCYDALSARMVEISGFEAGAVSGFAVEAAHLGSPDIGLMTMTELSDQCRRITGAVDIPIITDVDTGFGDIQNIFRTVRAMELSGVAGLHIEDQALPKKCPLLPGRKLVSIEEAVDRFAVALEARRDLDTLIIARTDADVISYDEQIKRANRYLDAGVDVVMPMMLEVDGKGFNILTPDQQMRHIERVVSDVAGPIMYVGPPPEGFTTMDISAAGVKIISHSAVTLDAAATAMKSILSELFKTGETARFYERNPERLGAGIELLNIMGLQKYLSLEERYSAGR